VLANALAVEFPDLAACTSDGADTCCPATGVVVAFGSAARASSKAAKGSLSLAGVDPWVCCWREDAMAVAALMWDAILDTCKAPESVSTGDLPATCGPPRRSRNMTLIQ
jgi:hypothetical protein